MAAADNHQHTPPSVCLEYKWRQDIEMGLWHIPYGEKEWDIWRRKDRAVQLRLYSGLVEIVCTEHVCLSAFMDCEIFPCCECVHTVHASPAGEIHSCKLMRHVYKYIYVHFLSCCLCEVTGQARAHGCVSEKITESQRWRWISVH